jgi:AraC-like DNA-binding protein
MKARKAKNSTKIRENVPIPSNLDVLQPEWSEALSMHDKIHFELFRRDEFRLKNQQPFIISRKDLFMVFLITGGEGIHTFGQEEYYLKPGTLCFVAPGTITSSQSTINEYAGYLCVFTSAFYVLNLADKETLFHFTYFNTETSVSLQLNEPQTKYFYELFRDIEVEYLSDNATREDMIRALLMVLLLKAQRLVILNRKDCLVDNSNAGIRLTKSFTKLFEIDFEPLKNLQKIQIKSLAQYAVELHVTQNYLNDTIKAISGKTPGELIREKIIREASSLLLYTQLNIAEICYLLKFEDPSYFSRFFKRYTGLTPTEHRKQAIK